MAAITAPRLAPPGPPGGWRPAVALVLASVLILTWHLGAGPAGWIYLGLLLVWMMAGVPIGAWVFGSRHPVGWIAGAALGYPLSGLLLWLPVGIGVPEPAAFLLCWLGVTALLWVVLWPRRRARVELPVWSGRDTVALALVLLLVPAMLWRPLSRIGEPDAEGSQQYRAYFTADFLWHMALTAELERFNQPPHNPYYSQERLHYYWLHFVPPAVAAAMLPDIVPDRVGRLATNSVGTGMIFVAMLFAFTWIVCGGRAGPAALAVGLALVASSAEGLYLVQRHARAGAPLDLIREINVDAVTAWFFGSFTFDGLQRSLMYNPQHSMGCATALVALCVAARQGSRMTASLATICGLALGLALMTSPFPGGALTLAFGLAIGADLLVDRPGALKRGASLAAVGLPIALALVWSVFNLTFEGAGSDLRFGPSRRAWTRPFTALGLAAGPLLVPALIGLVFSWRLPRAVRPSVAAMVVALALLFFVSLRSADVWVGWRAGQILLVTAPALGAVALSVLFTRWRRLALGLVTLVFVAGAPTTALDLYNAQDVDLRAMGPGFSWTVTISQDEQEALAWIRAHTPSDAVVQMEPTVRGRETWTLIPSFAERRMAAGLPISLLDRSEYQDDSERVRQLYATLDPEVASGIAREMGINYIYVDRVEREHFPDTDDKFDRRRDLFMPVFRNDEVRIYWVQ